MAEEPHPNFEHHSFNDQDMKSLVFTFQHTIQDYQAVFLRMRHNERIVVEDFIVGNQEEVVFDIIITPKCNGHVDVKLHRVSQKIPEIWILRTKAGLMSHNGMLTKFHSFKSTRLTDTDPRGIVAMKGNWIPSFSESVKREYLIDGCLTIVVKGCVKYARGQQLKNVHRRVTAPTVSTSYISQMKTLFNNQEFSDVVLIVDERKFFCQKSILSVRSPVFNAMFSNKSMKENVENTVSITDITPELFEEMLQFIYTDCCPNLVEMAPDLLFPADKYDLEGLRVLCQQEMTKHLSIDNACDYFIKSGLYNSPILHQRVLKFIKNNLNPIMKSEGWKEIKGNPDLLSEILESIAKADTS